MTSLMTDDQAEAVIAGARGRGPSGSTALADAELGELTDALAALRTALVDTPPPAPSRELGAWLAPGRRAPRPPALPAAWWRRVARTTAGLGLGVQIAIGVGAGAAVAGIGIAQHQGLLPGSGDLGQQRAPRPEPLHPTPAGPRHQPTAHPHVASPAPTPAGSAPAAPSPPAQHDPVEAPTATGPEQEQEQEHEHDPEHGGTSAEPADLPTTGDVQTDEPVDAQSDGPDGSEGSDGPDEPDQPDQPTEDS